MKTIDATLEALEHINRQLAALDPSLTGQWRELLGDRQQFIEELLFLLDSLAEPPRADQAARLSSIWTAAEALTERLRVHRALVCHHLAESHRGRFLCMALSAAPASPSFECKG